MFAAHISSVAVAEQPYSLTFLSTTNNNNNLTTYTFSSVSFGPATATREIFVVAITGGGTDTLSSATIGGVSATLSTNQTSNNGVMVVAFATVPTGTSGDIVLNYSTTQDDCRVAVYRVYSRPNIGSNQTDYQTMNTNSNTTLRLNAVTTNANGFSLFAARSGGSPTSVTGTPWTLDYNGTSRFAGQYSRIGTTQQMPNQDINWSGTTSMRFSGWSFD